MNLNEKVIKCCYCKSQVDISKFGQSAFYCCEISLATCLKCANKRCPQCGKIRINKINHRVITIQMKEQKIMEMSKVNSKKEQQVNQSKLQMQKSSNPSLKLFQQNPMSLKKPQNQLQQREIKFYPVLDSKIEDSQKGDNNKDAKQNVPSGGNINLRNQLAPKPSQLINCLNCDQMFNSTQQQQELPLCKKCCDQSKLAESHYVQLSSLKKAQSKYSEQIIKLQKQRQELKRRVSEIKDGKVGVERQSSVILCFVCGQEYQSQVLVKNVSQNENQKLYLCWKCEEKSLQAEKHAKFRQTKQTQKTQSSNLNARNESNQQPPKPSQSPQKPSPVLHLKPLPQQQKPLQPKQPEEKLNFFLKPLAQKPKKNSYDKSLISESVIIRSEQMSRKDSKRKYSIEILEDDEVMDIELEGQENQEQNGRQSLQGMTMQKKSNPLILSHKESKLFTLKSCHRCEYSLPSHIGIYFNAVTSQTVPHQQVIVSNSLPRQQNQNLFKQQWLLFFCSSCLYSQTKQIRSQWKKCEQKISQQKNTSLIPCQYNQHQQKSSQYKEFRPFDRWWQDC